MAAGRSLEPVHIVSAILLRLPTNVYFNGVCCGYGKQPIFSAVLPRLDGAGEFCEDRYEPMLSVNIHAEFIVAATEVLDESVPGTDHPCGA